MNTLKKKALIVMLPIEKANLKKDMISLNDEEKYLGITKNDFGFTKKYFTPQHLYFVTNEPIKSNDWFIINGCILRQCNHTKLQNGIVTVIDTIGGEHHNSVCKKVIATTNTELFKEVWSSNGESLMAKGNYPQPSDSFISKFISEYNRGNIINEVMVDYNDQVWGNAHLLIDYTLKVDKNNCITITRCKESWSREEVIELLHKKDLDGTSNTDVDFNKWIENNL